MTLVHLLDFSVSLTSIKMFDGSHGHDMNTDDLHGTVCAHSDEK